LVYKDNDILVSELGIRPCAKCGKYPNEDGDDDCIANLGVVMNACCGHGDKRGYIQFDSGIIIEGKFEIIKLDPYIMPYKMRTRQEIFDKIEELENEDNPNSEMINMLKWTMQIK
jgi:hypothetical protein